jgi:hypothetical protein
MNDLKGATIGRCFLTWLAATAAAGTLVAWAAPDLTAGPGVAPFDAWLTWLCAVVATLCALWGWVVTTVVVLGALRGRAPARGVPAWARTVVLGACGVAAIGSGAPALAAEHHQHEPPSVLEGLPLPDRAEGAERRSVTELVAVTFAEHSERFGRPATSDRYQVRRGDSLWSIAKDQLGDPALWPQLYALNRDVVGPDPDLIQPGQLLRLEDIR